MCYFLGGIFGVFFFLLFISTRRKEEEKEKRRMVAVIETLMDYRNVSFTREEDGENRSLSLSLSLSQTVTACEEPLLVTHISTLLVNHSRDYLGIQRL